MERRVATSCEQIESYLNADEPFTVAANVTKIGFANFIGFFATSRKLGDAKLIKLMDTLEDNQTVERFDLSCKEILLFIELLCFYSLSALDNVILSPH